jgi:alkanesulfonate monooxygenase SsuD/methylene tetrahydromethanopterin reductase-like flavin-dependent oxidoreductase (luciferase family)
MKAGSMGFGYSIISLLWDVYEAWTLLAAMAQATQRIRIGCLVSGNTYRHPGVLAKMVVTVDHLSGGRLDVGLGTGAGREHAMLGVPLGTPAERIDRLIESCQMLKMLWTEPTATFQGRYYQLDDAIANPKPVQRPYPPLWIGGSGEKRTLRVVAEHADAWINGNRPGTDPEDLARLSGLLDQHCMDIGRDPAEIRRAVQVPLPADADETVKVTAAYLAAGFRDVILMLHGEGDSAVSAAKAAAAVLPRLHAI